MDAGKWITLSFVLFAAFIATLVVICVRQDVSLISKDYYQRELQHGEKMQQQQNFIDLTEKPVISMQAGEVKVTVPFFEDVSAGQVMVQRPSDAHLDHTFDFQALASGNVRFTLPNWQPGLYRVSLTFTMAGKSYYTEKLVVI